ncbi:putative late blight resistance protein homolog R1B-13 [Coffea arabica]|uniref:Late blight resistance protein homolog R1B-13 n=1 Tax=Coffea arabica TaxID=13443 RepID=A0A6P6TBH8_COFAR|nr:putative late blight resistance protein homolog R1B-14 [Coffea arabica]
MTRDEIGEKLYKRLKGKRYLVVIDDIWDFGSWSTMKWYFPDDMIGSKILITSQIKDAVLEISPRNSVHFLRFLTHDESWNLFESKVFTNETCPEELMELGSEIVAKCEGLPLAIVVLAGLAKAKDEKFLQPSCGYSQISTSPRTRPILYHYFNAGKELTAGIQAYRIPDYCKCFHSYWFHSFKKNDVILHRSIFTDWRRSLVYKLLRVLDLGYMMLEDFPMEIVKLVHLKYLALLIYSIRKLPPLSSLWNLETFILDTEKGQRVILPQDIWRMIKLRHLHISGELDFQSTSLTSSTISVLCNLQSISHLCPSGSIQDVLARIPNVTNLACHLTLSNTTEHLEFPDLSSLELLETLKFHYQTYGMVPFSVPEPSKFPPHLKKLTLIGSHIDWKGMSVIGMLPNLEILKIKDNFFNGPKWETGDEGFCHLKFLKLSHTDLQQWIASSSSFPSLEQLVLNGCLDLEEIPSSLEEIYTLEIIEVYHSCQSVADSARRLQEIQSYMGNDELKVLIHPNFEEE